uniref:Uncharacterized protein n=1 Tax=Denticeps clupeoides TaxID=299321 RepID=A0AAY4ESG0_9TELE
MNLHRLILILYEHTQKHNNNGTGKQEKWGTTSGSVVDNGSADTESPFLGTLTFSVHQIVRWSEKAKSNTPLRIDPPPPKQSCSLLIYAGP